MRKTSMPSVNTAQARRFNVRTWREEESEAVLSTTFKLADRPGAWVGGLRGLRRLAANLSTTCHSSPFLLSLVYFSLSFLPS